MDKDTLIKAAQYSDSGEEWDLEWAVFCAYNSTDISLEDVQKVLGQLWFAFVHRQEYMNG